MSWCPCLVNGEPASAYNRRHACCFQCVASLEDTPITATFSAEAPVAAIVMLLLYKHCVCGASARASSLMPGRKASTAVLLLDKLVAAQDDLMPKYAELVYNGFWFSPERKALQALVDSTQEHVTGTVRLKLYKVRWHVLQLTLGNGNQAALSCCKHMGHRSFRQCCERGDRGCCLDDPDWCG